MINFMSFQMIEAWKPACRQAGVEEWKGGNVKRNPTTFQRFHASMFQPL
jgi:hypothetical protein